jgi:enoyl-[acyl-carrier protein] reductase II
MLAGMGLISHPELAAAVSNAGGLGTLRAPLDNLPREQQPPLREEIRRLKSLTDKPFGVDLLFATVAEEKRQEFTDKVKSHIEVICEEKPAYLIAGLGNPAAAIPQLHAAGIKVFQLVGNIRQAKRAEASGVNVIIAQSYEAGGHTGRIGGMVLIPAVVDAVKLPVVAAGGIVDSRQFIAALVMGACGVLMGTRFITTPQAWAHEKYKRKIVEIDEEGTVITRAYTGKACRVIRNKFVEEWKDRDAEVLPFPLQGEQIEKLYWPGIHMSARRPDGPGDLDYGAAPAGQGSGMINSLKDVSEIMEEMTEGVIRILEAIRQKGKNFDSITSKLYHLPFN